MHPLSVFIDDLRQKEDWFVPTLHDYHRINLALQAGGEWKITQLRDMLAALLVKTPEQDMIFQRRFKEFFELHVPTELSKVDVQPALQDLRSPFEQPKQPPRQQNNGSHQTYRSPDEVSLPGNNLMSSILKWFLKRKYALLGLIGITFGFIIWLIVWVLT
jgi:hypothetical protein